MLTLVITEKPSVAQSLAAALGADKKQKGYISGNGYIVSWCLGHLVELMKPDEYDPKYRKWRMSDLPILPEKWQCKKKGYEQFDIVTSLMNAPDTERIICATDAGREGELIFRWVYDLCQCKKPVDRLWISSLEAKAIKDGFDHLQPMEHYDNLYKAAQCRAQADWLIGMNASRLYSLLYNQKLNVGRVMTPTLALITSRERAISAFQQEPIFHVQLSCGDIQVKSRRFSTKEEAEAVRDRCHMKDAIISSIEQTHHADKPPYLYDLTTLQRDANRIHGYTAKQTLDAVQSLYEKRLSTYPRTDSRFLTNDMAAQLPELIARSMECLPFVSGYDFRTDPARVLCDEKVSDHHAIIPTRHITREKLASLNAVERNIMHLIALRLVVATCGDYRYDKTTVTVTCEGETFTGSNKVETEQGWLHPNRIFQAAMNRTSSAAPQSQTFSTLSASAKLGPVEASILQGTTTAPAHYTEDRLLSAMETAGVEEMPEDAERKGIGTPATRAETIEKLIAEDLIERIPDSKKQHLMPTAKGYALVDMLPDTLTSPLLTAEWEQRLKAIEHGKDTPDAFLKDISVMLYELVNNAAVNPEIAEQISTTKVPAYEVLGKCPFCGNDVELRQKGAFCVSNCGFQIWWDNFALTNWRVKVTPELVQELMTKGSVYRTDLWSSAKKKTFSARIVLEADSRNRPYFRLQFQD